MRVPGQLAAFIPDLERCLPEPVWVPYRSLKVPQNFHGRASLPLEGEQIDRQNAAGADEQEEGQTRAGHGQCCRRGVKYPGKDGDEHLGECPPAATPAAAIRVLGLSG